MVALAGGPASPTPDVSGRRKLTVTSASLAALEADLLAALRTGRLPQSGLLDGLPAEARGLVWQRLQQAIEPVWQYQQATPPGRQLEPAQALRPLGQVPLEAAWLARQPLAPLHRLVRLEGERAVEVLELFVCCPQQRAEAIRRLGGQMRRLGQLSEELVRRTWVGGRCRWWGGSYGCCAIGRRGCWPRCCGARRGPAGNGAGRLEAGPTGELGGFPGAPLARRQALGRREAGATGGRPSAACFLLCSLLPVIICPTAGAGWAVC